MIEGAESPLESSKENREPPKTDGEKLRVMFAHNAEMYRLPGDPSLTPRDIERYTKSAEALDSEVDLERDLQDKDFAVQLRSAGLIDRAPEADQPRLRALLTGIIDQGFEKDRGFFVGFIAAGLIDHAPEIDKVRLRTHITKLIEHGLENQGFPVRLAAAGLIDRAPEIDQPRLRAGITELVTQGFTNRDPRVFSTIASLIIYAPEADRAKLIEQGLNNEFNEVRFASAELIIHAPEADRVKLIEQGLRDAYFFTREIIAKAIISAPEADRTRLIELGLGDILPEVRCEAAKAIVHTPEEEQTQLRARVGKRIEQDFEAQEFKIRVAATELIRYVSETDQMMLIERGFGDRDPDVRREAAKLIDQAPEADRARLIEQGFRDRAPNVRREAARFFSSIPEADRARLIALLPQGIDALQTLASTTPLYKNTPEKFFRARFEKTGSGTTLLDTVPGDPENTLRERLIIRHVTIDPVLSWKSAYEAADFWKAKGFEYVPVEPLVKFTQKKDPTMVDAFTRVLRGPSVITWEATINLYAAEIDAQVEKLRRALGELGIKHGHLHGGNFIVLFDRDEKGEVILTRPPRVYVIDFDQAKS